MAGSSRSATQRSTDALLASISKALLGDRKKVESLVRDARGRVGKLSRKKLQAELERRTKRLRELDAKAQRAGRRLDAVPRIKGAKPRAPRALPPTLVRAVRRRRAAGAAGLAGVTPASLRADLDAIARTSSTNARRAVDAIRHNGRSIDAVAGTQRKLLKTQQRMAKTVAELQARGDLALLQGLSDGFAKVERGLKKAQSEQSSQVRSLERKVDGKSKSLREELASQATAATQGRIGGAASSMQTAAFGREGSLLDLNNVVLAGNQVLWSNVSDLVKRLGLGSAATATLLGWLSPLGSLATSQLALGRRQNERFIAGTASGFTATGPTTAAVTTSLEDQIGSAAWDAFRRRTDVLALTAVRSAPATAAATAQVVDGSLTITVQLFVTEPVPPELFEVTQVSWVVDTRA